MKDIIKHEKRNSWKRNFGGETMSGREAILSCVTQLENKYSNEVTCDYTGDAFDWLCRAIQDPVVYTSKEQGGLFHFYIPESSVEYQTVSIPRKQIPIGVEHLIVDYDGQGNAPTMLDIAYRFREYNIAMYTSPSNQDGTRFRLCLEISKPLSRAIYTNQANRAKLRNFFVDADPTSFDWSRYFYPPCVVEDKNTVYSQVVSITGKTFDAIGIIGLDNKVEDEFDKSEYTKSLPLQIHKSFKAKMEAGGLSKEQCKEEAIAILMDISSNINSRGAGYDVHANLLIASNYVKKAEIDNGPQFMIDWLEAYSGEIKKRDSVFSEISRMF